MAGSTFFCFPIQFDFTGLTRLQGHCHFIRLQGWLRLSYGFGHRCSHHRFLRDRLNLHSGLNNGSLSGLPYLAGVTYVTHNKRLKRSSS